MDDLQGTDPQTLGLIIQMQLEDLEEMAQTNKPKGKGRAGEHDTGADLIAAIDLYNADLTATAQYLADEAMCRSIANAVEADADLIGAALDEEDQVARDRNLAFDITDQRLPADMRRDIREGAIPQIPSNMSNTIDEDTLERLRALNISPGPSFTGATDALLGVDFEEEQPDRGESSSWAQNRRPAPRTVKQPVVRRTCTACTDQHPVTNLVRSPSCGHEYCRDCLISLFTASLTDETLFPPKCCQQPIPIEACRRFLTWDFIRQFNDKTIEYDTPNPTYCHRQACSAFVPPLLIHDHVAHCNQIGCFARTCTVCKGAAHTGSDCPEDPATHHMLQLAAAEGWQRCRSCKRFVELQTGCNHITCRCGAQFCYVCGEPWKTCSCAQWEERHLLDRANRIVDRDAGPRARRAPQPPQPMARRHLADMVEQARVRADLVEQARANLVENHECDHTSWRSRGGSHQCEECFHTLPNYIYECRQCRILACRRCRFNRL